jgi:hypothetical protein
MKKSTQNLNSCSFDLQVVLKELQAPPPDNPQKIYRCHLYVSLERLHVPLMREPPEMLKCFSAPRMVSPSDIASKVTSIMFRQLLESYRCHIQIALKNLQM